MRIELEWNGVKGELTTEHAASSYNIPVLVVDDTPYAAGESVDLSDGTWIGSDEYVACAVALQDDAIDIVRQYVGDNPEMKSYT